MTSPRTHRGVLVLVATLLVCLVLASPAMAGKKPPPPPPPPDPVPFGMWVTGDSHNHTQFSDGNQYLPALVYQAFSVYKLDWLGSTDHGGEWDRDANGVKYWADTVGNGSGDIWAWDGMLDNWDSFNALRAQYTGKVLFQGLEWGVPGIDESKTVVLDKYQQPGSAAPTYKTGMAMSDFEFLFDKLDDDFTQRKTLGTVTKLPLGQKPWYGTTLSRTGLTKNMETFDKYPRGLEAAKFLGTRYANTSYSILSHPSRDLLWTALDIRRYNDAAPTVFFGMAGMPGSQKEPPLRGGYDEEFFNDDGTLTWNSPLRRAPTAAPTTSPPRSAAYGTPCSARAASSGSSATPTSTRRPRSSGPASTTRTTPWWPPRRRRASSMACARATRSRSRASSLTASSSRPRAVRTARRWGAP